MSWSPAVPTLVLFQDNPEEKYVWWSTNFIQVDSECCYTVLTCDIMLDSIWSSSTCELAGCWWGNSSWLWVFLSITTGGGKCLCYAILSYVQTNRDIRHCFLHLHFELNFLIDQDEASLAHTTRGNTLLCDSLTASRAGKASTKIYTYTCIEHDDMKLAFSYVRDAN